MIVACPSPTFTFMLPLISHVLFGIVISTSFIYNIFNDSCIKCCEARSKMCNLSVTAVDWAQETYEVADMKTKGRLRLRVARGQSPGHCSLYVGAKVHRRIHTYYID